MTSHYEKTSLDQWLRYDSESAYGKSLPGAQHKILRNLQWLWA